PEASANDLIFRWSPPARGKWAIAGFLLASLAVHAVGFYLFQILYPPAVALLPPPGRVSLIAPNSDEGLLLLRWLDAEDPALASTTQAPVEGKSLTCLQSSTRLLTSVASLLSSRYPELLRNCECRAPTPRRLSNLRRP